MEMVRVKFIENAELKHGDGTIEFSATAGSVMELSHDVAHRWFKRNKAVLYNESAELQELEEAIEKSELDETLIPVAEVEEAVAEVEEAVAEVEEAVAEVEEAVEQVKAGKKK